MTQPALSGATSLARRRNVALFASVAAAALAVVLASFLAVAHLRQEAESRMAVVTKNLARAIELTVDGWLDTIDVSLQVVADQAGQHLSGMATSTSTATSARALDAFVGRQKSRLDDVGYIAVADATGRFIATSGDRLPAENTLDRKLFLRLRDDASASVLTGEAGILDGKQKPGWQVARRIQRDDGSFGGIVVVAIDLDALHHTMKSIDMPSSGSIALRDADLRLIFRHQFLGTNPVPVGNQKLSQPFAEALKKNQQEGTYISGETAIDNVSRTHSYRRNARYGFTANVGLARDIELADWRHEARMIYGLAAVFVVAALVFSWMILRAWRQQDGAISNLWASREELRAAQQIAGLGHYSFNVDADHWESSAILDDIFGIHPDYPRDLQHWLQLIAPESRESMQHYLAGITELLAPFDCEYCIVRVSDGDRRWVHGKGEFRRVDGLLSLVGVIQDITKRHQAETEIRIAATVFESQEGMMITDPNNIILRVNQAFTKITGYTAEEVVGRNSNLLKSGRHNRDFYQQMWQALQQTGSWQGEIWNRRKNGEVFPEWLTITAVKKGADAVSHYVATLTDITLRKASEDEIKHLAFYDPLTRLPNRRLLLDRLRHALASSTRSGRNGALLFIDLDNFKTLNDTLGHDKGDLLLQQVATRLAACVREDDTVARQGGDEFVVMLEDLSEDAEDAAAQAEIVGEKILAAMNEPYQLAEHTHRSTPSIGATLFNDHQCSIDELLKQADLAMYQVKAAGRNAFCFFDPKMQAAITARVTLEAELRRSLEQNHFCLHYQVQVNAEGGATGAEALIRWQHPIRGLIFPADFIPLAEEISLILPLGHWVLQTACARLADWAKQPELAHLTLAVNVSAKQFQRPDFVDQVLQVLTQTGADPSRLKLEITESMLLEDVDNVIARMATLKRHGVSFSLDDFGTGYSSLSYLKRLPLNQLKIDQSFVREILQDTNDAAIAHSTVALTHSLGLTVIAEGVENAEQRDCLHQMGCRAFQGYLFGRPMPPEDFESLVRRT